MTTAPPDLRTSQVLETRRRIGFAVAEILAGGGASDLSFPEVAERAGVSLRTVYRHFPNKEALAVGALQAGSERAFADHPLDEQRLDSLEPFLRVLWTELMANRDLVVAQHMSAAGRSLRAERLRDRRGIVDGAIRRDEPDLSAEDRDRLSAIASVLTSGSVLLDLVEGLEVSVDEAAALAAFTIEAVLDRVRREGGPR